MTKEPKLDRARRILPEWEGLDKEIQELRNDFEKGSGKVGGIPSNSNDNVISVGEHDEL
jgi:hypothetical protein